MTSDNKLPRITEGTNLVNFPPPDRWDDWEEYDARSMASIGSSNRYQPRTDHVLQL